MKQVASDSFQDTQPSEGVTQNRQRKTSQWVLYYDALKIHCRKMERSMVIYLASLFLPTGLKKGKCALQNWQQNMVFNNLIPQYMIVSFRKMILFSYGNGVSLC